MGEVRDPNERIALLESGQARLARDMVATRGKLGAIEVTAARQGAILDSLRDGVGEIKDEMKATREAAERAAEQRSANRPQWLLVAVTVLGIVLAAAVDIADRRWSAMDLDAIAQKAAAAAVTRR